MKGFPMSATALSNLPEEYHSDCDSDAPPATPRSVTLPWTISSADLVQSMDIQGFWESLLLLAQNSQILFSN